MKKYILSALALTLCSTAFCQIRGSISPGATTMSHFWFPGSPAQMLVERKDVQAELGLTQAQLDAVKAIEKKNEKTFMEKPDENWKQMSALLSAAQQKRMLQLSFQACGVTTAIIPGFGPLLGLTKQQAKSLDEVQHNYLLGEDKELLESSSGDAPQTADQLKAARALRQETLINNITLVLTKAQIAIVKSLSGKPFTFAPPSPKPLSTWIRAMGMSG